MPKRVVVVVVALCCALTAAAEPPRKTLVTGWYPWDPYNTVTISHGNRVLSGLDVELTREALAHAGYNLNVVEMEWPRQLAAIEKGQMDLGMGVLTGDSSAQGVAYSEPYRRGVDVLFVRAGTAERYEGRTLAALLPSLRARGFRLGAAVDYSYGPEVDRVLANPGKGLTVVRMEDDLALFRGVESGTIDGFLIDRLTGTTMGWRTGMRDLVEMHPAVIARHDIRVMFSPTVSQDVIDSFNRGVKHLRRTGAYSRIVRHHTLPLLLAATVDRPWFVWIDVLATVAFALSGVMLASREKYSIFGAFVLASLPALGGPVLRDLVAHRHPLGIVRSPEEFLYVGIAVILGTLFHRIRIHIKARESDGETPVQRRYQWAIETFDAMGLATLTVIGVLIALETQSEPLLLWGPLLAVLATCGGGIMRNMVRADAGMGVLKGSLYAEVSIVWAVILSAFFYWQSDRMEPREIVAAVTLCTIGAFVMRIVAAWRGIRAPMF